MTDDICQFCRACAGTAVPEGPVGQSRWAPARLAQQGDDRCRETAGGRIGGFDPQGIELALAGDPMALRLCVERILPVCRERAVRFALPPIESPPDIAAAMKAVTSALAKGAITPGEADRIAAVVDTFVRPIETSEFERRLQELEGSFKAQDAARVANAGST